MPEDQRNGELDLMTKSRIAKWQTDNGLPVAWELTLQTYEQIRPGAGEAGCFSQIRGLVELFGGGSGN